MKIDMISFIGAGKVGSALGLYFKQKGLQIGGYYSKTHESAERAAKLTESKAYNSIEELLENSSMVWITVSDDALLALALEIAQLNIPTHIEAFVHTSGVHSSAILKPIKNAGFSTHCAHPLMAFGNPNESAIQLYNAYFSLETPNDELKSNSDKYLVDFLERTNNHTLKINPSKKGLYHCAATVLSNYLVTLLNLSYEMFAESGMTKSEIKKATAPLLQSTLKNIAENNELTDALTGAIKRGDRTTVLKHLATLEENMPDKKNIYIELGKETMAMLKNYDLSDILKYNA